MRSSAVVLVLTLSMSAASALEPPRRGELAALEVRGDLAQRREFAARLGNHRLELQAPGIKLQGAAGLPTTGTVHVLALLVEFPDNLHTVPAAVIDSMLFGDGSPANYPKESLRRYYLRSSYGQLDIQGTTLGWYTALHNRDYYVDDAALLIQEILGYYDSQGHDFSVYDNDGDGQIDVFNVFWTGEVGEWASFWWGWASYFSSWGDANYSVDGKTLGRFTWQWEDNTPRVVIHETGHALGLPDYYDYDDTVGPDGGLGSMDIMSGSWGDHNGYSKWMLGWLTPQFVTGPATSSLSLPTSATSASGTVVIGAGAGSPNGEFFVVQNRTRTGNDSNLPGDGLLIFHVDSRLGCDGMEPMFNNTDTEHKLISLVEADGADDIEREVNEGEADDFFRANGVAAFGPFTTPSSDHNDGSTTGVELTAISAPGATMSANARVAALSPAAMPLVTAPAPGADSVGLTPKLGWQPVSGAGGYQVELHSGTTRLYRANLTASESEHTVPQGILVGDGAYSVWVRALGDGAVTGAGPYSRSYFATRACGPARWDVRTFANLSCGVTLNHPGIAYDEVNQVVVQFGGGASTATYEYDGSSWTAVTTSPAPTARTYPVLVPDPAGGGLLLFGGVSAATGAALNDTWRYQPATRTWVQLNPPSAPSGTWTWRAAADTTRGVVVLVSYLGTWEWDGSTWTDRGPGAGTPPLYAYAVAYDVGRRRVVLFGGARLSNGSLASETWEYDGSSWSQVSQNSGPAARIDHSLVYHDAAGVTLAFGGRGMSGRLSDVWAWYDGSWSQVPVCDSTVPLRWFDHAAYDPLRKVVVTGGWGGELATWELRVQGPLPVRPARRRASGR